MALTQSKTVELGYKAENFALIDTLSQKEVELYRFNTQAKATVIMFICNHCPYVKHILDAVIQVAHTYTSLGIQFIAINSNDAEAYPEDRPQNMQQLWIEKKAGFPYLYDETQEIAKRYDAVCTPEFMVFDHNLICVYKGQFDDARPKSEIQPSGKDLRMALDALLEGNPVSSHQIPSIGCSIKWKV